MRKILYGLSIIVAVTAVVVGATTAFYNDEETSSGNVLAAGSIDLGIDNHSYYNGVLNDETTWRIDYDIEDLFDGQGNPILAPKLFFNFDDLKPGDWGEDTISLHVKDNESWLCADVTLTSDNDNGINEPEGDDGDVTNGVNNDGIGGGELADAVNFYWWADDGDNVFETCGGVVLPNGQQCVEETLLPAGPMGALNVGQTATVALADSVNNIWTNQPNNPLYPEDVRFVGKAWCFGDGPFVAHPQDGGNQQSGPDDRPVVCDGSNENNLTQTDSMTVDITFRAEQFRHQPNFTCEVPVLPAQ